MTRHASEQLKMVDQQDPHTEPQGPSPDERLQELLEGLWDRVRRAGDHVKSLRAERDMLKSRLDKVESEFEGLRRDLTEQKKQVLEREEQIRSLHQQAAASEGKIMSNGEKEALVERAKELLARIEGYL